MFLFPGNSAVSRKDLMFTDLLIINIDIKFSFKDLKLCSSSCKPVRNRILISKERNITVSGDLSGLLINNFVRRNLAQRAQVLLLKAFKRDLIGCSMDS
jgi:hypothetical protein